MIVLLFRVLIFIALACILYTIFQYFRNPRRKLQIAKEQMEFFLLDEEQNSKKNLQFVYKGCLFEGEKYLGTTEQSFEVVTIQITAPEPLDLRGLTRDDLYFLEKELLIRYPYAQIEWKHPINKLLITPVK
ncbi:sigma-w pathway protein ysdB [Virgibacillus dakarensis]|uniref:Sigma-w pathway protein YsdB n=1 Tax=Lentibacillus populi TaxID=1827502 RepID=A0A9W5TUF0_9BACI|nr:MULTISPECIES: sigma-w pathway protein ysdB [Bacillaceae]MBT2218579.1 sigma-w pathway protein ysdB [Virgibacillus dakarensis]MTW84262.1 sigma-w pathway protein ysdB [Virgibacillus dakarensis]GGB27806.1 sigma-w pathway protein YsdB [Lentibacillus populi]